MFYLNLYLTLKPLQSDCVEMAVQHVMHDLIVLGLLRCGAIQ